MDEYAHLRESADEAYNRAERYYRGRPVIEENTMGDDHPEDVESSLRAEEEERVYKIFRSLHSEIVYGNNFRSALAEWTKAQALGRSDSEIAPYLDDGDLIDGLSDFLDYARARRNGAT